MGFVNGTLIQIDSQNAKAIEKFVGLDTILAFDFIANKPANPHERHVMICSGPSPRITATFYAIVYVVDAVQKNVICTPDQPFLMEDGTMKVASELVPQKDYLWLMSGELVLLADVVVGKEDTYINFISTSDVAPIEMNGNLIVANGVICGDYSLQMT